MKKRAYSYLRISDDDHSHFSLPGQEKMNRDFGERHNIEVIKAFKDDGYSAKDFNRPAFKELERELLKNKNKIDYLIVWKYDRLIRNAAESLAFIEKLEKKWNIILVSVMENFGIDPNSPYFFKHRADLLVAAEFERRLIADRTKFGNWMAKEGGRYIGVAPLGYTNAKEKVEGKELPILEVNEKKQIVELIYDDFLNDVPNQAILKKVNSMGVKIKGHGAISRIISNPTYGGLIKVPAYNGKKSYLKQGIHTPIIPIEVFWKAYYKLQDQTKLQGPKINDENVPLRGYMLCQSCGGFHTGGKSKGRTAYYYYYRCRQCNGENYSSEKVHKEIMEILKNLSLQEKYIQGLISEAERNLKASKEGKTEQIKKLTTEYNLAKEKLESLEEKFIANKVSPETYDKWFPVYSREVNLKEVEIGELNKDDGKELERYNKLLPYLCDLPALYSIAGIDDKQNLLKGIFWGGLTKEKEGARTKILNPMFALNHLKVKDLLRVEIIKKPENISGFLFSTLLVEIIELY